MKLSRALIYSLLFVAVLFVAARAGPAHATERSDIFATGTVQSFGSYKFAGKLTFDTDRSGTTEIGRLQVTAPRVVAFFEKGVSNGPA